MIPKLNLLNYLVKPADRLPEEGKQVIVMFFVRSEENDCSLVSSQLAYTMEGKWYIGTKIIAAPVAWWVDFPSIMSLPNSEENYDE